MTRVHVTGAAGYAAAEAIRLLHAHPYVEVGVLESRSHAGEELADHFPLLRSTPYRFAPPGSVAAAVRSGDVVITAGGDEESRAIVPALLAQGARVIDLSAAYRADDGCGVRIVRVAPRRDCRRAARRQSGLLSYGHAARALAAGFGRRAAAHRRRREERDHRRRTDATGRRTLRRSQRRDSRLWFDAGIAISRRSNAICAPAASAQA